MTDPLVFVQWALPGLTLVLGALIGSFLNVVVARLPRGQSIVHPHSHCPRCGDKFPGWLNVPIFSWIALGARCRACRTRISVRYPVVELLTALLFLACLRRFGLTLALASGLLLTVGLVTITFIDIDVWEIPDEISLPGIVIGCLLRPIAFDVPWWSGIVGAALGALALGGVRWGYWLVKRTEGMGLGDVKLIAMIGAFLGAGSLLWVVMVASLAGTVIGLVVLAGARRKAAANKDAPRDEAPEDEADWVPPPHAVPFGPFLALGGLAYLLFEPAFHRISSLGLGV